MLTLIARRLVWCVVVMFFITVFVFILYFVLTPVSPALLFAGKSATPSQIEALDMGRRGLHNEGSELLRERLAGKIEVDLDTARRLFTLICALHITS